MDTIEFLNTTEQKNIKSYIGMKVRGKLREYEAVFQERQRRLKDILEFEGTQYQEELVQLLNDQLQKQFQERLKWNDTATMERAKAEEEILKLKNQQRELDNCEEWRHFRTKQKLLDSKKGQLYQIEDKKLRTQKEKDWDKIWHTLMDRFNSEKEDQEAYASKLAKVIEERNQLANQELGHNRKTRLQLEYQQAAVELQEQNSIAQHIAERRRESDQRKALQSQERYNQMLKFQIASNVEKKAFETQLLLKEACLQKELEDHKLSSEGEEAEKQKIRRKEWNIHYLNQTLKEKEEKIKERLEFEQMYLNTGCILQQAPKTPYGKNAR